MPEVRPAHIFAITISPFKVPIPALEAGME